MRKFILSMLLALTMLTLLTVSAFAAAKDSVYLDVDAGAWYADAVAYCREEGLMSGTTATTFDPAAPMTRSMLVAALYRIAGEPAVAETNAFTDSSTGTWYANAVTWSQENGIVSGYRDGRFGINDFISREQLAAILWRSSGSPKVETNVDFIDEDRISAYASDAVDWVSSSGIMAGKVNNLFDPAGYATRAEVAVILVNYIRKMGVDEPGAKPGSETKPSILIAYFSWAGHTKQIAEEIQMQVGGDLFEIQPEKPYTDNINELSGIAMQELRENARPALGTHVENMARYDIVFVGYPCWWSNAPMPVFTFLEEYSFTGKIVIPFTSYGENVWGRSLDSIADSLGDVQIADGFATQEHQMQDLSARIRTWLLGLNLLEGT